MYAFTLAKESESVTVEGLKAYCSWRTYDKDYVNMYEHSLGLGT